MGDVFQTEKKALEAMALAIAKMRQLMEDAEETAGLFLAAGMPVPKPLKRMLAEAGSSADSDAGAAPKAASADGPLPAPTELPSASALGEDDGVDAESQFERPQNHAAWGNEVPPPHHPPRPEGAEDNWIWLPIKDLSPQTLILSILGAVKEPITTSELAELMKDRDPEASTTSVWNVGHRLDGRQITRTNGRWRLVDGVLTPVLYMEHAWGPPDAFTDREVADYRREIVLHVLRVFPTGMTFMDLVRMLEWPELCKAPGGRDAVKRDLEILRSRDKAAQIPESRKWVLKEYGGSTNRGNGFRHDAQEAR